MSAERCIALTCDICGEEYIAYETNTLRDARREACEYGWATNLIPSPLRPAEKGARRDVCDHCIEEDVAMRRQEREITEEIEEEEAIPKERAR